VASLRSTVLIQGESGTGKEVFAQAIHNASCFKNGPFVALNCAAVPGELIESELFGYEDGAFTGARKSGRHGKFELAENGTIFLDEINSMSMPMQTKLLRVIQTRKVVPLGDNNEININARLICASNKNLLQLVKKGLFRQDLFYRIDVLSIDIPPLRKRVEDIPLIAHYFCDLKGKEFGVKFRLNVEVIEVFCKYDWPGNIRELENVIERGMVMALGRGSQEIELQDVMKYHGICDLLNKTSICDKEEDSNTKLFNLGQIEIDVIQNALKLNNRNLSQTAKSLGISRTTLYRKIKYYGID
jgi:transcriptional regulator with PAS, ATPase and Fis domain